nr:hypothetical protein [Tanacetum cinerariifolium]
MTPATSSSALIPNLIPQQPFNLPTRFDWDHLFQPMFNEYFNPLSSVVYPVPVANAPRAIKIAGSPSSTTIDQDAPSSKPKNLKEAMLESSWIEAMLKKINLAGYSRTRLDWFLKDSDKKRESPLRNPLHWLPDLIYAVWLCARYQCNLLSSGISLPQQGELFFIAVGMNSSSGNSSLAVGMP